MSVAQPGMMVTPSVKLVRPLGEGGMGSVWVADHLALHTQVVVKFIASELAGNKDATDRFAREAAAAAQVKSPHVVQTFDHGVTEQGSPYIVMEYLEGRDLGAWLDEHERLSQEQVGEVVVQLCRALERAHARGIVHRDIKPGNIFLCEQGREIFVKLLDFGIAKGVEGPKVDSNTKTGTMIGSPFYMSPEQILGAKDLDHRTDLWSVGVVAYEALTGRKPFDAETMGGLAIKIHSQPLPNPCDADPTLPPSVDAWFKRACARDVGARFASAKELAESLIAALGGQMPRSVDMPRVSARPPGSEPGAINDTFVERPTLVAASSTNAGVERPGGAIGPARRGKFVALGIGGVALVALGLAGMVRGMGGAASSDVAREGGAGIAAVTATSVDAAHSAGGLAADVVIDAGATAPAVSERTEPATVAPVRPVIGGKVAAPAGRGGAPPGKSAKAPTPPPSNPSPPSGNGNDIF